jgi:hypothetical protein
MVKKIWAAALKEGQKIGRSKEADIKKGGGK